MNEIWDYSHFLWIILNNIKSRNNGNHVNYLLLLKVNTTNTHIFNTRQFHDYNCTENHFSLAFLLKTMISIKLEIQSQNQNLEFRVILEDIIARGQPSRSWKPSHSSQLWTTVTAKSAKSLNSSLELTPAMPRCQYDLMSSNDLTHWVI